MKKNGVKGAESQGANNDFATTSVPPGSRRSFYGVSMVWVGWCISLSAFLTGGTIGAGNKLGIGLLAVLVGNLLLFALASLCGTVGVQDAQPPHFSKPCSEARAPWSSPHCSVFRP